MANNEALQKAAKAKKDEFYTQMADIEAEMRHYKDQFRDKVILCNCDDPYESNFFKYFALNFNFLGLRKLIAISYAGSPVAYQQLSLLEVKGLGKQKDDTKQAYKIEISEVGDEDANGTFDLSDVEYLLKNRKNALTLLSGNGDFRSEECIELLKKADIVVTNPPFSLFREYVAQLVEFKKKFIIIGNVNAITYRDVFKFIAGNKIWLGQSIHSGDREFRVPDYYPLKAAGFRVDEKGTRFIRVKGVRWFTNLDFEKRHERLTLYKRYIPEEYPRYFNYDAIEVSKTAEIPYDFDGEMGVPVTFLDKYNPEQFEIIGSSRLLGKPMNEIAEKGTFVSGGVRFYLPNGDGTYRCLYDRIVIKRKGNQQ